jgi:hypothetical protein
MDRDTAWGVFFIGFAVVLATTGFPFIVWWFGVLAFLWHEGAL